MFADDREQPAGQRDRAATGATLRERLDAPRTRDHWWPRPGWRPGRDVYTWHLTFEHSADLQRLADQYQSQLGSFAGLNLVPVEWLHLTVQGVGYVDEVPETTLSAVIASVRDSLSSFGSFTATFATPVIFDEAIVIRPTPVETFQYMLSAIRSGIAAVLGEDSVPTGPEQAHGFRPHVSLAYSNGTHDTVPYRIALDTIAPEPVDVEIQTATLIRQERLLAPDWLYRWTTVAQTPLAT